MYIHICLYACMHVCMYMYVYVCIRENLTLSGNVRPMAYGDDSPKNIRTWWFHHSPSFIIYPLWNIWKSVRMIIPNIWKNSFKKCSKPPTSNCLVIIIYPSTLYDDEIYVYTYYIYTYIYKYVSGGPFTILRAASRSKTRILRRWGPASPLARVV